MGGASKLAPLVAVLATAGVLLAAAPASAGSTAVCLPAVALPGDPCALAVPLDGAASAALVGVTDALCTAAGRHEVGETAALCSPVATGDPRVTGFNYVLAPPVAVGSYSAADHACPDRKTAGYGVILGQVALGTAGTFGTC